MRLKVKILRDASQNYEIESKYWDKKQNFRDKKLQFGDIKSTLSP